MIILLQQAFEVTGDSESFKGFLQCYGKAPNCKRDRAGRSVWYAGGLKEFGTQVRNEDIRQSQAELDWRQRIISGFMLALGDY